MNRRQHVLVLGLFLFGCSSESTPDHGSKDASGDVTTTDDGGTDASDDVTTTDAAQDAGEDADPTACNTLSNIGTVISQTFVATDPQTGDGGPLTAGTYVLTAAVVYTGVDGGSGPTGTTLRDTVILDGAGTTQRVASIVNDAGLDGSPIHQNASFVVDGGSIHVDQTCPPGFQPFTSYDSDGTKFHIYAPAAGPGNPAVMFEYTKQ